MMPPSASIPVPSKRKPWSFERRFAGMLLGVVLLSILAFGVSEGDAALTITLMSAASVGWLVTETGAKRGVPRWATVLVLIGILIGAIVRSLQGTPMVSAFSTFLASIIVLKLWERREVRDYGQLITLCLFLVIGAALTATTVWIGVTLFVLTPAIALVVMMYQVYASRERARPSGTSAEKFGVLSWARAGRGLKWTAAFTVIAGSGIAVAVFVVVPRGEGLQMIAPSIRAAGRQTGFTDRVDLGVGGLVSESQTTVMEVQIRSGSNVIGSPGQRQYLRGLVLDQYLHGVWTRSNRRGSLQREEREAGQILPVEHNRWRTAQPVVQTISLRAPARTPAPVFGLYRMLDVEFVPPRGELGPRVEFEVDRATGCVTHREHTNDRVQYVVRSRIENSWPEDEVWERDATSFESIGVFDLAATLLANAGIESDPGRRDPSEDARAARVFESHLKSSFSYTLNTSAPPAQADPTEWFLLTLRRGHCEHFASGLVALCRSVGIEARVIAGYLASEFDAERGVYVVRQSNAHAWVEVRTGHDRWTTYDATPPGEIERLLSEQRGLSGLFGRLTDSLENMWNSRVAMFDSQAQARLFGRSFGSSGAGDGAWRWARGLMPEREDGARAYSWAAILVVLAVPGAVFLTALFLRARRSGRARSWGLDGEAAKMHRALEKAIARRRGRRPEWIPLARWAQAEGKEIQRAAELVYSWAFGGVTPSPTGRAEVRKALRSLRA